MSKQKKTKKNISKGQLALVTFVMVIVLALVSSYIIGSQMPKYPVEEYFKLGRAYILDADYGDDNTNFNILILHELAFNLSAVGGDAHNVIVAGFSPSVQAEELGAILKNQTVRVELIEGSPRYGKRIERSVNGTFPLNLRLYSSETDWGTLTIEIYD